MSEDRLEEIKREHDCGCEVCSTVSAVCPATASSYAQEILHLRSEIERLTFLHNLDHSLADQWQKKNEVLQAQVEEVREELDAAHRFLNDIGPPPDLPLPDRLRHWQNYCRVMRDDMREKDATIAALREALEKYGVHRHPNCTYGDIISGPNMPRKPCVCGLAKALATPAQEDD